LSNEACTIPRNLCDDYTVEITGESITSNNNNSNNNNNNNNNNNTQITDLGRVGASKIIGSIINNNNNNNNNNNINSNNNNINNNNNNNNTTTNNNKINNNTQISELRSVGADKIIGSIINNNNNNKNNNNINTSNYNNNSNTTQTTDSSRVGANNIIRSIIENYQGVATEKIQDSDDVTEKVTDSYDVTEPSLDLKMNSVIDLIRVLNNSRPGQKEEEQKDGSFYAAILNTENQASEPIGAEKVFKEITKHVSTETNGETAKVGLSAIKDGIIEKAESINQKDGSIYAAILNTEAQASEPIGAERVTSEISKHLSGESNGETVKVGLSAIKDNIIEKAESLDQKDGSIYAAILNIENQTTDPIGAQRVVNEMSRIVKENENAKKEESIKVGVSAIKDDIIEKAESLNQKDGSINAAILSIENQTADPIGAGQVINEMSRIMKGHEQRKNNQEEEIVKIASHDSDDVTPKVTDSHDVTPKSIIQEMIKAIRGYHINKPPKEREIEVNGDKIRVRVNRVKENKSSNTDFNGSDVNINEV